MEENLDNFEEVQEFVEDLARIGLESIGAENVRSRIRDAISKKQITSDEGLGLLEMVKGLER